MQKLMRIIIVAVAGVTLFAQNAYADIVIEPTATALPAPLNANNPAALMTYVGIGAVIVVVIAVSAFALVKIRK